MLQKSFLFLCLIFINFLLSINTFADSSIQEKCFNNLVKNIEKLPNFQKPLETISKMDYSSLEKDFSKYYKNMSSFGVDLDTDLFEMRLYSFGEQTGYNHPPFSPYPISTKTEKWNNNAKEFILAEEYIRLPNNEKQFLSCSFMQIESWDLMKVTSENYLYDWDLLSVIQTNNDNDYKAWYNENISYNHDNNPFVTWKRLFIYPKETQNEYFNKYDILDNFPSKKIEDFNKLFPNIPDIPKIPDNAVDENGIPIILWDGAPRIYQTDENGKILNWIAPDALMPVKAEGFDEIFALNSYYQSIENTFPEFSKNLALRWVLHYDTMKKLFATKDNDNFAYLWNTVLDSRDITKYALKKKQDKLDKEEYFYEKYLNDIPNIEKNAQKLLNKSEKGVKETKENFVEKKEIHNEWTEDDIKDTLKTKIFFLLSS